MAAPEAAAVSVGPTGSSGSNGSSRSHDASTSECGSDPESPDAEEAGGLHLRSCSFAQLELLTTTSCKVITPTHSQRAPSHIAGSPRSSFEPAASQSDLPPDSDFSEPHAAETPDTRAQQPRPLHPSHLDEFKHKASGHHLMFRTSDGRIAKESTQAEERFYHSMQKRDAVAQQFCPFIAEFEGVGYLSERDLAALRFPSSPLRQDGERRRSGLHSVDGDCDADPPLASPTGDRVRTFLLLRDLTHGFQHPCTLDLKMGVRNYGLGCSQKKRASKKRKTRETTSAALGLRVHGMRRWEPSIGDYVSMDKLLGRELQQDSLLATLRGFFAGGEGALGRITDRLERLIKVFEKQEFFHFYTTSLLLFFDMKTPAATADVCMIDFAYTYPVAEVLAAEPGKQMPRRDEGYLLGLRNLLRLLTAVRDGSPFVPLPPTVNESGRPKACVAAWESSGGADVGGAATA
eukprot:TRINITY_DN11318_c0_g1_i1.p1 TRINITY_DN11318_c0_g1~~TRINITY_DN11318_c0_g1_i1.p1  ORF type:complete len:493 (+),score=160.63 TRINITY_DN11318_c0_g1_i1:97-1479(+)